VRFFSPKILIFFLQTISPVTKIPPLKFILRLHHLTSSCPPTGGELHVENHWPKFDGAYLPGKHFEKTVKL